MSSDETFGSILADHRAAVREYTDRAKAVSSSQWFTPRAEGKWTPAEETRHLILAYEALARDLLEGKTLRLRGTPWKRRLWRAIGMFKPIAMASVPTTTSAAPSRKRCACARRTSGDRLP